MTLFGQAILKFSLGVILIAALLEKELAGYAEYKQRVKYRLIPFVW